MITNLIKGRWDNIIETRPGIIPPRIINYAKSTSKISGLDFKKVLKSTPVKKYRDKMWLDR